MRRIMGASVIARVVMALSLAIASLGAQKSPAAGQQRASRLRLEEQLASAERQVAAARSGDKARLLAQVAALKARLESGDFKVGDRFVMTLRQDAVRSDTLVVRDSLRVAVLNLPEFSVAGILRSELEDKLAAHVSRFLRNASVRTTQLVRVSVTGAVRNPGFYYALPDRPINDLLTVAGGPALEADLNKITISRIGKTILNGKDAKQAVEQGTTLEELDVQGGDTVHVPLKRKINWRTVLQLAFVTMSLFLGILRFLQWYYNQENQ